MEAGGGEQVKSTKNHSKQHRQDKEDSLASVEKVPNHEEELAAQLVKIERELRHKERKLEKYNRVLKAKKHVRDTLRHHNAVSENQGSQGTGLSAQDSPPRSIQLSSSRNVTFSTRSPEVQYVATRCETPTSGDRDTPPPATHSMQPQGYDEDVESAQKLATKTNPFPPESNNVDERDCVVESDSRENVMPVLLTSSDVLEGAGGPHGERDSSVTDVTLSGLVNEELNLCLQAIIEDTEHVACEPDTGGTKSSPLHPPTTGLLGQAHLTHSTDVENISQHPPADFTGDLPDFTDQCWGDWSSLPSPPVPDPPAPSANAEQCYSSSRSLPCNQAAASTELAENYHDKCSGEGSTPPRSPIPGTAAPPIDTITPTHLKGHIPAEEEKPFSLDLFGTQCPPEADALRRSCISQHRRWRNRVSQSGTESTGSSTNSRRDKTESSGRVMKEEESSQSLEGVREAVEMSLGDEGKEATPKDRKNIEISQQNKMEGMSEKCGEESLVKLDHRNITHPKNADKGTLSSHCIDQVDGEGRKDIEESKTEDKNDVQMREVKDGRNMKENIKEDTGVQIRKTEASRFTRAHGGDIRSFCHQSTRKNRHQSTSIPPGKNTHRQKNQAVKVTETNKSSHTLQKDKATSLKETLAIKPDNLPCSTTGGAKRKTLRVQESEKSLGMEDMNIEDVDNSLSSISSSHPSIRLVEGPKETEVEMWTLPVKEGHGVLLTTAVTTIGSSCILLMVQECGLGLWRPSLQSGAWTLVGETKHNIKDIAEIRDIRAVGLPSGDEARFLMVAQREGQEEEEVVYVQFSLSGGEWLLSSSSLKPPVSGVCSLATCVLGEWSAGICWSPPEPSSKGTLTLLDFDVAYSRRAKKWELLCHPCTCPLPDGVEGRAASITSLFAESGSSGLLVCWSSGTLTLFDPWKKTVITSIPSPTTGLLWALAVKELLFVLGQRPGQPDITLTAMNPLTGLHDPFLTFTLSKGTAGVPPAALMEGGSPWRMTGVSLQPDRLTLSFSGGHGAHVYFKGMTVVR